MKFSGIETPISHYYYYYQQEKKSNQKLYRTIICVNVNASLPKDLMIEAQEERASRGIR